MKTCTKCGKEKALEGFYVDRRAKDGRTSACKPCVRHQQRFEGNCDPEKRRQRERRYHRERPGYSAVYTRRWQENNRERHLATRREYRERKKEEISEKWKAWAAENPDLVRQNRERRRMRKLEAYVEDVDLHTLLLRDLGICGICADPIMDGTPHIDHIIPLAAGGEHSYANTQLAHAACNFQKGAKLDFSLADAA